MPTHARRARRINSVFFIYTLKIKIIIRSNDLRFSEGSEFSENSENSEGSEFSEFSEDSEFSEGLRVFRVLGVLRRG
jgi:hypothetical protein